MANKPLKRDPQIIGSGRKSALHGAKYTAGFIIRPEQMLELLHDALPNAPIPFDAQFQGIGIEENGADSKIRFFFTSLSNPLENCIELDPHYFLKILKGLTQGMIPLDAELNGIEVSSVFTVILLRVVSDHFPPHKGPNLPLYHLRYEAGQIHLVHPAESMKGDKRIQLSDIR